MREVELKVLVDDLTPCEAEVPLLGEDGLDSEGAEGVESVDASP